MARHRTTLPHPPRTRRVHSMRLAAIGCILLAIGVVGCGGGHKAAATAPITNAATTTGGGPQERLTGAVRAALRANHRLAKVVLWRNVVPASAPESTRGPALAALRSSAAGRRRRGVRAKVVFDGFRIESVTLDPSFTRATAIVSDPQRVQPYDSSGKALGQPTRLSEKSRFELHRLSKSQRFVVWQVSPVQ
jgi:hypothetical protein